MKNSKILELKDAESIAEKVLKKAEEENLSVAVSVVDAGGHLILFKKMDGTQIRSIDIAIKKAQTSLFYKRPTKAFQNGIESGNSGLLSLPDILPFEGGVPVEAGGEIIGAVGVSGATPQQDGEIAKSGLDAI